MICSYGHKNNLTNELTSIIYRTPPLIRKGENNKKMNMSGAMMGIYLHWEEREHSLEELTALPKLNFQHMFALSHIRASFFYPVSKFGVSERYQTDEQSTALTAQTSAQANFSQAQLSAAPSCRQMISRLKIDLTDPMLQGCRSVSPPGMPSLE